MKITITNLSIIFSLLNAIDHSCLYAVPNPLQKARQKPELTMCYTSTFFCTICVGTDGMKKASEINGEPIYMLSCKQRHTFHLRCIQSYFRDMYLHSATCPTCGNKITDQEIEEIKKIVAIKEEGCPFFSMCCSRNKKIDS